VQTRRALDISEERPLAGRLAGALYLIGAGTATVLIVLPGIDVRYPGFILMIAALGALWGAAALLLVPWERVSPAVSHASSLAGFPTTAAAVALTGGATSPARFYLFFVVIYAAYFYTPKQVVAYVLACTAVLALPLAYDGTAISDGLLGELLVLFPTFVILAVLMSGGKQLLVELHETAQSLACQDSLTGIPNRRALADLLARKLDAIDRREQVALVLLDLDGFKDVNTLHGLPGGDRVLCETAAGLERCTRDADLLARLGGDEFAVVLTGPDEPAVRTLADRLLSEVRSVGDRLDMPGLQLSASVGWAVAPDDGHNFDELFASADVALRSAKAAGKDRAVRSLDRAPESGARSPAPALP